MKTPEERYNNDPQYRYMVDQLETIIGHGEFTPSELRQMVIFACIKFELRQTRPIIIPRHIEDSLHTLEEYLKQEEK